jgi:hypothetical protein
MRPRNPDVAALPDRPMGIVCLVIAVAMCTGAGAVSLFGGSNAARIYGSVFMAPPALGMLWIGLDLTSGMRLSKAWSRLARRG